MRAAAYARYSTDNQTENSIAYQLNEIQKYARENAITLCAFYSDEAQSGTNIDRKAFREMSEAAERHEFDAVIIYDISRGSRDVADWFTFRKAMARLDIKVISATQSLGDITNPNDFLLELISVGLGQHAVLDTRKKSMAGVAEKAKEGVFLGGYPPLGYDIVNGHYVINDREAQAVRRIFSMYAEGKGYSHILEEVKDIRGKRGRPLGKNSLPCILHNERYIGVYTWNKKQVKLFRKWAGGKPNPAVIRLEHAIPAIIDMNTWERVQKRLKDNKRRAVNKAKREYLLSGLIECDKCGATYVGHCSTNQKGYQTRSYICGNKYRTRTCSAKNLNADELEVFVVENLKAYFLEADFDEIGRTCADAINSASDDLTKERAELAKVEQQISNGMKAILGGMEFPELEDEVGRLRVRKAELQDIIAHKASNERKANPDEISAMFRDALEHWDDAHIKNIIQTFVEKIYAHGDGSVTVHVGVHISGCGGRI